MEVNEVIKYVKATNPIKKVHIYGLLGMIVWLYLVGIIAVIEYKHYMATIVILGLASLILIYVPLFIRKHHEHMFSKLIGHALYMLVMILTFNYIMYYVYFIEVDKGLMMFFIYMLAESVVALIMWLYLMKNIHKGLNIFEKGALSFLGLLSPILVYLLLKASGLAEVISEEIGVVVMALCLGVLWYPVFSHLIKAYYMDKYQIFVKNFD